MNEKHAIVFDLGGVLIDWNPRYLYRKVFNGDEQAMEKFLADVCNPDWNAKQDEGRRFAEAIEELVARHPSEEQFIRVYFDRWPEMVGGAIEGTVDILCELRQSDFNLYALSNWSAETYPHARNRFAFFEWFDHVVISGEIKMIKPHRGIFDHLLEKATRRAEECVFIDDSITNVTAATEFGLDAIHFKSPDQLREELTGRGILARR